MQVRMSSIPILCEHIGVLPNSDFEVVRDSFWELYR